MLLSEGTADGLRIYELLLSMRVADGPPMPGMKSEAFGKVFAAIAANKVKYAAGSTIRIESDDDIRMMTSL